jgi:hypothetical protein
VSVVSVSRFRFALDGIFDRFQFLLFSLLTPDIRLRGRSRYGAAKARNLKPHP